MAPCPRAWGSGLACRLWVVTGPQRERQRPSPGGDWNDPASGPAGLGPAGQGGLGGDCQGRGPLPGPWWVGQRPPGSGCEARPLVAATINMFVQGKPGWELCALAWGGRKGRLCLAHWADCLCSRNCCPVAGKVRRPSGPVGSNRCLRPLCSLTAVVCVARSPSGPWHGAGRCQERSEWRSGKGKGGREARVFCPARAAIGRSGPVAPAPGKEGARVGGRASGHEELHGGAVCPPVEWSSADRGVWTPG